MKYILIKDKIQSKSGKEFPIVILKGQTYDYKKILEKHKATYNGVKKAYFWWLNGDINDLINSQIKPALEELAATIKSDKEGMILDIDAIIATVNDDNSFGQPGFATQEDKVKIVNDLASFKKMLTNIDNDEDFKEIMGKLIQMQAAQGYSFSLKNTILIYVQTLGKAGRVNSATNWFEKYNRVIKNGAKPIMVYGPQGVKVSKSKDTRSQIEADFYASIGKSKYDELTPNEKITLDTMLRADVNALRFVLVPVFSQHSTVQIEGTEDHVKKADDVQKTIKWYDDEQESDDVAPIYNGLLEFAKNNGITVDIVDDLGGSRGVSKSGSIDLLKNSGKSVGTTKTLAHEITHELLHQKYLKQKGGDAGKFKLEAKLTRDVIEQQAELSAWMFMYSFGFDVKTTSLNYTVLWGGRKESMIEVFNTVSDVVNFLIDNVNKSIGTSESQGSPSHGNPITPDEIANLLGLRSDYNAIQRQVGEGIMESRKIKIKINERQVGLIIENICENNNRELVVRKISRFLHQNYEPTRASYKKGGEFHEEVMLINKVTDEMEELKEVFKYVKYKFEGLSPEFLKQVLIDFMKGNLADKDDNQLSSNVQM